MALFAAAPAVKPVTAKPARPTEESVAAAPRAPAPAKPSLVSRLRGATGNEMAEATTHTAPEEAPIMRRAPSAASNGKPSSAPAAVKERPSRQTKEQDKKSSLLDQIAQIQNSARREAAPADAAGPVSENGPYPAASLFPPEEWAAIDDGQHHVFEIRNADGSHATLARLPYSVMPAGDLIGVMFDRTIVVTGTVRPVSPPLGYKAIRVEMKNLGGEASILFPENRPFLKELCTRAPMVITTKSRKTSSTLRPQ